jgi:hypothetical protein
MVDLNDYLKLNSNAIVDLVDSIVVRLGSEYDSVKPSDFLISVSELSAFFLLDICAVTISSFILKAII